jgi:HTH-type transcriptional regulator/antitoxin HigA
MTTKLIKTQEDYDDALARADTLMDAEPGTPDGDELEVLAALIEMYEDKAFPIGLPSVADAIKFRMDQMDMRPRDLMPFIGSAARVSEVLAGKRPLTLKMARALHTGLGIPAEILLQDEGAELPEEDPALDWSKFPIVAMVKAKWFAGFKGTAHDAKDRAEELVRGLFERASPGGLRPALLRQGKGGIRSGAEMDPYALSAWQARVMELAGQKPLASPYQSGTVTEDFIRDAVKLSYFDEGPRLVGDFLGKSGIHFVVLPHLPRTHLDGAAMWAADDKPLVALTLRHDRLDNFWFCLAHELAHVKLHLDGGQSTPIFDDLDLMGDNLDDIEKEADRLALQAQIDEATWRSSGACHTGHPREVRVLAKTLRINPAIVAGRVRHETRNYRALTRFVGLGEVRKHFQEAATGA